VLQGKGLYSSTRVQEIEAHVPGEETQSVTCLGHTRAREDKGPELSVTVFPLPLEWKDPRKPFSGQLHPGQEFKPCIIEAKIETVPRNEEHLGALKSSSWGCQYSSLES
jgi:hypothetical protein